MMRFPQSVVRWVAGLSIVLSGVALQPLASIGTVRDANAHPATASSLASSRIAPLALQSRSVQVAAAPVNTWTHRHVIFIPGICPVSKGAPYAAFGCPKPGTRINTASRAKASTMFGSLIQTLQKAGVQYTPYFYSYPDTTNYHTLSRFNALDFYLPADTHVSLAGAAKRLNAQLHEILTNRRSPNYDAGATFDLVGNGLGGVVAAYWVVADATAGDLARVHSLIAFDSPLQGFSGSFEKSQIASYWSGILANDLLHGARANSITMINDRQRGLLARLPRMLTFANARDKLVPQQDAWIGTKIAPWNLTLSACGSGDALCSQTVLKNADVLATAVAWIQRSNSKSSNASSIHSRLALLPAVSAAALRSGHNNLFAHPTQPAYTPQRGFAPDFQRVLDLLALQVSLAQYQHLHHEYSNDLSALFPQFAVVGSNGRPLSSPPEDPVTKQPYYYATTTSGNDYRLTATLDSGNPYTVGPLPTLATLRAQSAGAADASAVTVVRAAGNPYTIGPLSTLATLRGQSADVAAASTVTVERGNGALPADVQAGVLPLSNPAPSAARVEVMSVDAYWLAIQPGATTGGASLQATDWIQNAGGIWARLGLLPPTDITDPLFLTELHGDPAVWDGVFPSTSSASASVKVSRDRIMAYDLDLLTMIGDLLPAAPNLAKSVKTTAERSGDITSLILSLPDVSTVFNYIAARNFRMAAEVLVQLVNSNSGAIEHVMLKLGIGSTGGLVKQLSDVTEMDGLLAGTAMVAGLLNSYLLNLNGGTVTFTTNGGPPMNPSIGTFVLYPPSGSPGSTFTVRGTGWTPGSTVEIAWVGAQQKSVTVGSDGTFQAQYQVPTDASPGTHQVVVSVVCSGSCQGFGSPADFVVQETPASTPVPPTATPVPAATPPPGTPMPQTPTNTPAINSTFHISVATDKTIYAPGEPLKLCVTLSEAAHVVVTMSDNGETPRPISSQDLPAGTACAAGNAGTAGTTLIVATGTPTDGSPPASSSTTIGEVQQAGPTATATAVATSPCDGVTLTLSASQTTVPEGTWVTLTAQSSSPACPPGAIADTAPYGPSQDRVHLVAVCFGAANPCTSQVMLANGQEQVSPAPEGFDSTWSFDGGETHQFRACAPYDTGCDLATVPPWETSISNVVAVTWMPATAAPTATPPAQGGALTLSTYMPAAGQTVLFTGIGFQASTTASFTLAGPTCPETSFQVLVSTAGVASGSFTVPTTCGGSAILTLTGMASSGMSQSLTTTLGITPT
jgi:hypothetical protein